MKTLIPFLLVFFWTTPGQAEDFEFFVFVREHGLPVDLDHTMESLRVNKDGSVFRYVVDTKNNQCYRSQIPPEKTGKMSYFSRKAKIKEKGTRSDQHLRSKDTAYVWVQVDGRRYGLDNIKHPTEVRDLGEAIEEPLKGLKWTPYNELEGSCPM